MEKDVKIEDIAKDVTKVTDEELKDIQEQVGNINNLQMQVGGLELQKSIAVGQIGALQSKLQETQKTLEDKYGKVSVNLADGTLKPIEEDGQSDTKN